jgi:catechol 2,3-dioxygenase-like lactoylglutathione lyase family enzyme
VPNTTTAFGLSEIGQVSVNVKNLDRATAFYRDQLGVPLMLAAPNLTILQCGTVSLMLSPPETAEFDHPSSVLYFSVPDIGAAYKTLKERKVTFRDQPHLIHRMPGRELWMTFFDDTEGNILALMSWRTVAV